MTHPAVDDAVVGLLTRMRQRQYDEAECELKALRARAQGGLQASLDGVDLLLQWYRRRQPGDFEDGLTGAITGVTLLRDAGYRPHIAWDLATVGYAMGVLGDLETGIAWLELATEDARQVDDQRGLVFFQAHQGSLLTYAEKFDAAHRVFEQALVACEGTQDQLRAGVLNNMAYARLLKAQDTQLTASQRADLARVALDLSEQSANLMRSTAEFRHYEASFLETFARAHMTLGDIQRAEAILIDALARPDMTTSTRRALLVTQAELLLAASRIDEATKAVEAAAQTVPDHRVGPDADRLVAIQIELASRRGNLAQVQDLWQRRLHQVQDRYRERLGKVHEHAASLARLVGLQSEARAAQLELRAAETALLEAQLEAEHARERERQRLLQDLHDGLGSQLATARLSAQWGELSPADMASLLDDCMADLHIVVDAMGNRDGHLGKALRLLRNRTQSRLAQTAVQLSWQIEVEEAPSQSPWAVTQLLRIAQEALTNALKHAQAKHIRVAAAYARETGELRLSVRDDGIGFSVPTDANRSARSTGAGKGLSNMRQRTERLGGALSVVCVNPGTQVELRVSLK